MQQGKSFHPGFVDVFKTEPDEDSLSLSSRRVSPGTKTAFRSGFTDFPSCFVKSWFLGYVIPAQAGIQCRDLDSRLRGNDGEPQFQALTKHSRFT
jgi:hypothetical protein